VLLSTFVAAATISAVTSAELSIYPQVNIWVAISLSKRGVILLASLCLAVLMLVILIPVILLGFITTFLVPLVMIPLVVFIIVRFWFSPKQS